MIIKIKEILFGNEIYTKPEIYIILYAFGFYNLIVDTLFAQTFSIKYETTNVKL